MVPPCRAELPALERLADDLAPQGVAVSAIALEDNLSAVREYLARYAARLPGAVLAPKLPVVRSWSSTRCRRPSWSMRRAA
ncbi:hypothetical protein [Ramlibacter montanisoli]|uniref:Uncharacterized protein n=1 Tax=Ramlibacter montanisoli TaxID=2732512 RepID=A0A849KBT9_9BURK|nr:hypothetical protein [Ramlibacter montanisoli]NNU43934.1 hypothetical protein [Ramlibacter montanisoli]